MNGFAVLAKRSSMLFLQQCQNMGIQNLNDGRNIQNNVCLPAMVIDVINNQISLNDLLSLNEAGLPEYANTQEVFLIDNCLRYFEVQI